MKEKKQEPGLAIVGKRDGEKFIKVLRSLSPKEYRTFRRSADTLKRFSNTQQMLAMVDSNLDDYRKSLAEHLGRFGRIRHLDPVYTEEVQLDVNRRFLNLLAMIDAYLASLEATIKRELGRDSTHMDQFQKSKSSLLESSFSYRLVKLMRGCALHGGLPLLSVRIKSNAIGKDGTAITRQLQVLIDRDEFQRKIGREGERLRPKFRQLDSEFEVETYLDDAILRLKRLHGQVLAESLPELVVSSTLIKNMVDECGDCEGMPVIIHYDSFESTNVRMKMEVFPLHLALPILDLIGRRCP